MANLETIINRKTEADTAWKEQRQMERENVVAMRESGITEITSHAEAYIGYLERQESNPMYSPGNIALAMFQNPEATVIGTRDRWKAMGRTVLESEKDKGMKIFARAAFPAKGYTLSDAYDVSQTQGKAIKETCLRDSSKEMDTALSTLLNYSPVPVVTDASLDVPALYDEADMVLHINPASQDSEAFGAIATEIAHARFHNKGYNTYYDRGESQLDAQSVSYILCRRFGVACELPDASHVAELYEGWEPHERAEALDKVQDMAKKISNSIDRDLTPEQNKGRLAATRANNSRPAR
ncbi:hypothetical protein [Oscillibacter ruminantium]|uniref:hypothetical protein n=1 Tax=Oscillibacter ruminantium TaxID=1263547 RepID=UPI00332890EB